MHDDRNTIDGAMPWGDPAERRALVWLDQSVGRLTRSRIVIARALLGESRPPTAELLYRRLIEWGEDISLASVYRILKQWEETGKVRREWQLGSSGNKAVYVLGGDLAPTPACVFRCTLCGRRQPIADADVASLLAQACRQQRFRPASELVIPVQCDCCGGGQAVA